MCFQFDVYRNPSERTRDYQPYFMIIQHNKDYVCNLRSARSTVIAAIDALVTNT